MKISSVAAALIMGFCGGLWADQKMPPEDLRRMLEAGGPGLIVVDLRSPKDFRESRIPGSVNVPKDLLEKRNFLTDSKVVVYCAQETCDLSRAAAEILESRGHKKVWTLEGGIEEWARRGFSLESGAPADAAPKPVPLISAVEIRKNASDPAMTIVDLRPASEYAAGHIPGALSVPLEELDQRINEIPISKDIAVYDRTSSRSSAGAQKLAQAGFRVKEIPGGILSWVKRKYPLEVR